MIKYLIAFILLISSISYVFCEDNVKYILENERYGVTSIQTDDFNEFFIFYVEDKITLITHMYVISWHDEDIELPFDLDKIMLHEEFNPLL